MRDIVATAKAVANVVLEDIVIEKVITTDPLESWAKPSMQQDLEKVRNPLHNSSLKLSNSVQRKPEA